MRPPRPDDAASWEFDWDDGNVDELARHHIRPAEAVAVFEGAPRWLRNKRSGAGGYRMVGRTDEGRRLTIVVQLRAGRVVRVVTGWDT